jgi:phosphate:Na+ symporter
MVRLIPEHKPLLAGELDQSLLREPSVAITTVHSTVRNELCALLEHLQTLLDAEAEKAEVSLFDLKQALDTTQTYADQIHLGHNKSSDWERLYGIVHALDHMQRLYNRLLETDRASTARTAIEMTDLRSLLRNNLTILIDDIRNHDWQSAHRLAQAIAIDIDKKTEALRDVFMGRVASDTMHVQVATDYLKALRWLDRISTHIARITFHLNNAALPEAQRSEQ